MLLASIQEQARLHPQKIALRSTELQLSYAALMSDITSAETHLQAYDIHCLALSLDNTPAWVVWDLAALASKMSIVPIPAFFSPAQKQHAILDAAAEIIITDAAESWLTLLPEAQIVASHTLAGQTVHFLRLTQPRPFLHAEIAKITYTSGTTGQPKGVCLTQQAMWQVAASIQQAAAVTPDDKHFCILPFATLLENVAGVYATLLAGGTVVITPSAEVGFSGSQFEIKRLHESLLCQRASTAILIPELLRALVFALQNGLAPLPDLRFLAVGGARVAPALLADATALGLPVYEGYGLSECASVVTLNTAQAHQPGSIGKPLPHITLKRGEDGELWIKGNHYAGYTTADGNLQAPVLDADGFMPSGDLANVDAQGYWTLVGRKKNMFITSFGRNVSPEWVESLLCHGSQVVQVCVFGEAKPFNVAVIVAASQTTPAQIDAAIHQANAELPDYARISRWLVAEQPFSPHNGQLTANGRLKRDAIWQYYQASIAALYMEQP